MIAPQAEMIEGAVRSLLQLTEEQRREQLTELTSAMGADFCQQLKIKFPSEDFMRGYELGLQTMRLMIQNNPFIDHKRVDL